MDGEQKAEYEAQGFLTLKNALSDDELADARDAFDRAVEDGALGDLPNQGDVFIQLAEQVNIFPAVHRMIGSVIQLRSIQGERIAAEAPPEGWRNELTGWLGVDHSRSTLMVEAAIYLDDAPESAGCLAVVPGSHAFRTDVVIPDIDGVLEMPHQATIPVEAGTAIVSHCNLWKARSGNETENQVRRLVYTYAHCWMRHTLSELNHEALRTISASHNLSQLFSVDPDVSTAASYWHRQIEGHPVSEGLPDRIFSDLTVVGQGIELNKRRSEETL